MSKKGKIITSVIVAALVIALVAVLVTNLMNGGAKKIDRTDFQTYVENTQYYKDGKPNVATEGENAGKIVSVEDGSVLEGYKVKDGVIVTEDEKGTLTVIWKVSTKDYEYTGYTKNSRGDYVKSYYCYGP
ncbi:MAG: hypothetical protein K2K28_00820, partial [Clostridia bacterium]|nr:hypothetical protein [Clostridia bacterium]